MCGWALHPATEEEVAVEAEVMTHCWEPQGMESLQNSHRYWFQTSLPDGNTLLHQFSTSQNLAGNWVGKDGP